jgi:hypothetical protein
MEPLLALFFQLNTLAREEKNTRNTVESRYNSMSGEFKAIEAKKFITKRMSQRRDVESEINIKKAVNDIIDYIEDEDDLYGIIVSVRKARKKYSISLVDLEPIDLNLQGKIAVEEYKGWFCER